MRARWFVAPAATAKDGARAAVAVNVRQRVTSRADVGPHDKPPVWGG
ncbi:MAG: hypothetical protein JW751_28425 [Polyangiaceae bacterium]|nr:hypothetical protein [Polyangiaceae bacterium]